MKPNKLSIVFSVLILLITNVYAECPPDCEVFSVEYDYSLDEAYFDSDFYLNSDPNQWDYSKVDWEQVDFSRAEIYSSPDFYSNLPDDRYDEIDYTQVEYSQIRDHSKIDSVKYFEDLGCLKCSLDRGEQELVFSENGITHRFGYFVSVPGTYPSGSLFVATYFRIEVVIPDGTERLSIPTSDTITINTQGGEVTLADGTRLNGILNYDRGQAYVESKETVIINGIEVGGPNSYRDIFLFFDGEEKEESNYVSFGEKNIIISGIARVIFREDNPYVTIEEEDFLGIGLSEPGTISVENRDDIGLIPLVHVKSYFEEDASNANKIYITNGGIWLGITKRGEISTYSTIFSDRGGEQSTPLSIELSDNEGNNLIGTETEPKKILISNSNDLITIPLEESEGYTEITESYDYAPALVSERLSVNYQEYTVESFNEEFPNINLEGELSVPTIKRIAETLRHLPPEIRDSVRGFEIFSEADWITRNLEVYGDDSVAGAYTSSDRIIRIPEGGLRHSTIYHEAAHDLTFRIEQEEAERYTRLRLEFRERPEIRQQAEEAERLREEAARLSMEIWDNIDKTKQKWFERYRKLESEEQPYENDEELLSLKEQVDAYHEQLEQEVDPLFARSYKLRDRVWEAESDFIESKPRVESFETEWKSIAGDFYGVDLGEKRAGLAISWADGSNEPRNGFVRPYGANNYLEDIATFVENVYKNPDFYKPLITQGSAQYDVRYRQKLDLLYERDFITQEKYDYITGGIE
tara:strand:+ start:1811 stop:4069 length:2259 start_codon:yes stop_codon:yes gene_type:complete